MIDLHSHTNESDGTYSPAELVDEAVRRNLEALAITDHDTFAGYDQAVHIAGAKGLDLVCGIEINTRMARGDGNRERAWSIHLLGYFLREPPTFSFREWLLELLETRRKRNSKLVRKLQSMGVDIELSEVQALGRTLTGRPHFARVLMNKAYVSTTEEAFRKYLGESAPGFVNRDSPHTVMGIQQIEAADGMAVLAHPVRLGVRDPGQEEEKRRLRFSRRCEAEHSPGHGRQRESERSTKGAGGIEEKIAESGADSAETADSTNRVKVMPEDAGL